MNLLQFNPRWVRDNPYRLGMGLSFTCPHCSTRIVIWFSNPIDDGERFDESSAYFERKGNKFEELTITPVINSPGHWRGKIINGKLFEIMPKLLSQ